MGSGDLSSLRSSIRKASQGPTHAPDELPASPSAVLTPRPRSPRGPSAAARTGRPRQPRPAWARRPPSPTSGRPLATAFLRGPARVRGCSRSRLGRREQPGPGKEAAATTLGAGPRPGRNAGTLRTSRRETGPGLASLQLMRICATSVCVLVNKHFGGGVPSWNATGNAPAEVRKSRGDKE